MFHMEKLSRNMLIIIIIIVIIIIIMSFYPFYQFYFSALRFFPCKCETPKRI